MCQQQDSANFYAKAGKTNFNFLWLTYFFERTIKSCEFNHD